MGVALIWRRDCMRVDVSCNEGLMIRADRSVWASTNRAEGSQGRRRGALAVSLAVAICGGLATSPAWAGERGAPCEGFCNPVPSVRLDQQRGQGFETAVILWDELNRRGTVPPPPAGNQATPDSAIVNRGTAIAPSVILIGTGH
jgi:hypothetical protein